MRIIKTSLGIALLVIVGLTYEYKSEKALHGRYTFANVNGLHNNNNYSTAYDLILLAKAVYISSWIMDCLGMSAAVVSTTRGSSVTVYNKNKAIKKLQPLHRYERSY